MVVFGIGYVSWSCMCNFLHVLPTLPNNFYSPPLLFLLFSIRIAIGMPCLNVYDDDQFMF